MCCTIKANDLKPNWQPIVNGVSWVILKLVLNTLIQSASGTEYFIMG